MNVDLLVGIISAAAAIVAVVVGYVFSRRSDREADWRRLKLEHYKEFFLALSGIMGSRSTPANQIRYSDAVNSLSLVAPPSVIRALYAYQDETNFSNRDFSAERFDRLLNALIREIRRDVHPSRSDDPSLRFQFIDVPPDHAIRRSVPADDLKMVAPQ